MKTLKYKTPKALEKKIEEYFENTPADLYTISGICLYLHIHKDTFYEYAKREAYKDIVNFARLRIENSYELDLRTKGRAADIFAMKNFGWTDKQEIDQTVSVDEQSSGVIMIAPILEKESEDEKDD